MSNKNNLSVPGRIRTCDLQLRRLLLYPAELLRLNKYYIERVKGVEPSTSAWKTGVLPLNYTRVIQLKSVTFFDGREDRIGTCDPMVPNQVCYQAAFLPAFQYNAPDRTRTSNLLIRSQTLEPIELRAPADNAIQCIALTLRSQVYRVRSRGLEPPRGCPH